MPPYNNAPYANRSHWRFLFAVLAVVAMLVIGLVVYRASVFHLVKTDPDTSNVSNYSPYIRLYFNKPIRQSDLKISADNDIVTQTTVDGKTITLKFRSTLELDHTYTITMTHVASTSGATIQNQKLTFTAKDIAIKSLSKDQQQAIQQPVDNFPYSIYNIPFDNFDELTNAGLSSDQEQVVKQAVFNYAESIKTKLTRVTLDASSITPGAFDPNGTDSSRTLRFNVTTNDTTSYSMVVTYDDIETAAIQIYDQSGAVVFDNTAEDTSDASDPVGE